MPIGQLTLEASSVATALGTAFNGIKTDVVEYVGVALPVALGIVGIFLAIKLGIKFFKQVTGR